MMIGFFLPAFLQSIVHDFRNRNPCLSKIFQYTKYFVDGEKHQNEGSYKYFWIIKIQDVYLPGDRYADYYCEFFHYPFISDLGIELLVVDSRYNPRYIIKQHHIKKTCRYLSKFPMYASIFNLLPWIGDICMISLYYYLGNNITLIIERMFGIISIEILFGFKK